MVAFPFSKQALQDFVFLSIPTVFTHFSHPVIPQVAHAWRWLFPTML